MNRFTRRDWLRSSLGAVGVSASGWLPLLAADARKNPERKRACILLWMSGGPSTIDLWDLKPGHANGGPFKEIKTRVPEVRISEHLPKLATMTDRVAIVRSMATKEGDHGRATYVMRTGYVPQQPVQYPPLGSLVAKELTGGETELPPFVSVNPYRAGGESYGPGFLGPRFAPLVIAEQVSETAIPDEVLKVPDLARRFNIGESRFAERESLLGEMESSFLERMTGDRTSESLRHPNAQIAEARRTAYERASSLMRSQMARAFELDRESAKLRDAYGRNLFGQSCLLARRLVEAGVPFVEVTLNRLAAAPNAWDTHNQNFEQVKALSGALDNGFATLLDDLKDHGLLDTTTVICMGEFGRTPKINSNTGRDHYPNAWATVLAGGGIKGGQVIGKTSGDGTTVEERPVNHADLLATVCRAIGIDPMKTNESNIGRPIRIVDKAAKPIVEVVGS